MDLSIIVADWPYDGEHEANNVRKIVGVDGRMKVQLRIRGGLIQWEIDGRPDGETPYGCASVLEHCQRLLTRSQHPNSQHSDERPLLDSHLVDELVDELFDYGRRSRALFFLGDYRRALDDSLHSLGILRVIREDSVEGTLVFRYDRHRPSLLVERSRTEMLLQIQAGQMRKALDALNRGVRDIEDFYAEYEMEDQVADSSERRVLVDLRRSLREKYNVPLNDRELLYSLRVEQEIAIRKENYEMAARLRDKINLLQQRIGSQE